MANALTIERATNGVLNHSVAYRYARPSEQPGFPCFQDGEKHVAGRERPVLQTDDAGHAGERQRDRPAIVENRAHDEAR